MPGGGGVKRALVVGAGFAGGVVARELADSGAWTVEVIDQRDHIAGNAYDPVGMDGLRVHQYGPHIFHTNHQEVVDYLSRFTDWMPYRHRVEALVAGVGYVPFPITRTTLHRLYGIPLATAEDMRAFLERVRTRHPSPANARQAVENTYGVELTELFFARYSRKMWGMDLDALPPAVVARLPVRYDDNPAYFDDRFQMMPARGYLGLFERLLDHPAIRVTLGTAFAATMERGFDHVFTSMPIDVYFGECFGPLPYRSIRFHHERVPGHRQPVPTVNRTDASPITRETDWRLYPGGGDAAVPLVTREEPCSYEDNGFERYYPVRTVDGAPQARYQQYRARAQALAKVTFIGRCGQYVYFDMHQVVANSRTIARRFLGLEEPVSPA